HTRVRGQLLPHQELVEEVTGTADQQPINERIAQVRHDELRTFAAAISRASNRLIATAVDEADHQPSMFIERLAPWSPTDEHPVPLYTTSAQAPTVSGRVTHRRRQLEEAPLELLATDGTMQIQRLESDAKQAAEALAVIAAGEIKAADPVNWWGPISLSTVNPIHGVD